MPDEITSTDRRKLYKVVFVPSRNIYFVEASGAAMAQQKGIGLAVLDGVEKWTGIDVHRASEAEMAQFYGEREEE